MANKTKTKPNKKAHPGNTILTSVTKKFAITDVILDTIEKSLQNGMNISQACNFAEFDRTSLYRAMNASDEIRYRIEKARDFAEVIARQIVVTKIVNEKDENMAKWYLEHKSPEFNRGTVVNLGVQNNQDNNIFLTSQESVELTTAIMREIENEKKFFSRKLNTVGESNTGTPTED